MVQSDFAPFVCARTSWRRRCKGFIALPLHRAATFFGYSRDVVLISMPSNPTIERTHMRRQFRTGIFASTAVTLCGFLATGCVPNYSPDTYAAAAAQQANKVDQ